MSALLCTRCYAEFLLCPILLSPLNNPDMGVIMAVLQMGKLKPSKVGHMTSVIQMRSGGFKLRPIRPKTCTRYTVTSQRETFKETASL